ncbi:MAG: hypothetical protein Q8O98_01165, partial [bacterium]|nr:hypothetical protein [bacterium]
LPGVEENRDDLSTGTKRPVKGDTIMLKLFHKPKPKPLICPRPPMYCRSLKGNICEASIEKYRGCTGK